MHHETSSEFARDAGVPRHEEMASHEGDAAPPEAEGHAGYPEAAIAPVAEGEAEVPSLWGAGPRIVVPALLVQLGGAGLTLTWPGAFGMELLPHWGWALAGLCALLVGTLTVRTAWTVLKPGRIEGRLVTEGLYGVSRNPIYAGWILGILPGIAMCFASWPMLAGPVVAWALFRETVPTEEAFLSARYGADWERYALRVNRLWPNPFRRHR